MSGGAFDYAQFKLDDTIEQTEEYISGRELDEGEVLFSR